MMRNEKLIVARIQREWTQEAVAEKLGISRTAYARWEEKGVLPRPYAIHKACKLFNMSPEQLGFKRYAPRFPATPDMIVPSSSQLSTMAEEIPSVNSFDTSDYPQTNITELLQPLVAQPECAWAYAWGLGEEAPSVELVYDSAIRYETSMPEDVQQALYSWCKENSEMCREKSRDPIGALVRLERVEWSHSAYKYFILLSPSRYLPYVAIHPHLGKTSRAALRKASFANALTGLRRHEALKLPSNFALHMAVVSRDGHLLLRRRSADTVLYPLAWEAGIGEFMHGPAADLVGPEFRFGPYHSQFPHFTEDGIPDLLLFLRNAIAEELAYDGAQQEDFRLYGFAVEYETLAPKLLVVYQADCPIAALMARAREAKDRARELTSLKLTPQALAEACSNSRYSSWGPTSKLVMLLALRQDCIAKGLEDQSAEITRLIDKFEPSEKLTDPHKLNG